MSIPPTPTRHEEIDASSVLILIQIFPALARVLVELPREDQRCFNFQPFSCPVRSTLEGIVGQQIDRIEKTQPGREQFIWLARLAAHALELADEIHQFDGPAALDFATGYVRAEASTHALFAGPEIEEQALASAIERSSLCAAQEAPFALGFQARRDQLREAAGKGDA